MEFNGRKQLTVDKTLQTTSQHGDGGDESVQRSAVVVRCQLFACSTSLQRSTPSIMNYCYAVLNVSSVCVASCWSGSDPICLADRSVSCSVAYVNYEIETE